MPVIIGDKPIFRIKFSDADIREVRKGNELEWGLYEITYKNEGPITIQTAEQVEDFEEKNISKYVWGYPNQSTENFYLWVPGTQNGQDINDYQSWTKTVSSDGWNMRADGWFEDNACTKYLSYIPAINDQENKALDFHRDLTLYCKWTLRRYGVENGKIKYDVWTKQGSGGGSFTPYNYNGENGTGISSGDSAAVGAIRDQYKNDSRYPVPSGGINVGGTQCTWWCRSRSDSVGGGFSVSGNASAWYENWSGTKIGKTSSSLAPGDILCFDDAPAGSHNPRVYYGHVVFVENVVGDTIWTSETANSTNHPNWIKISNNRSISTLISSGRHWNWSSERYLGAIRPPNSSPGGGGTDWAYAYEEDPGYTYNFVCGTYGPTPDSERSYDADRGRYFTFIGSGYKTMPKLPEVFGQELENYTSEYESEEHNRWKKNQMWYQGNAYTEENYLTYNDDGTKKWSGWTRLNNKKSNINGYPPGSEYLEGWLLDWE